MSGANVCKACRSQKTLKNEPSLAIVAVHTAESEPLKNWVFHLVYSVHPLAGPLAGGRGRARGRDVREPPRRAQDRAPAPLRRELSGKVRYRTFLRFLTKKGQTLEGSFSSVSAPIFASKYSLESIFRDLQVLHTFARLKIQNFSEIRQTFFSFSISIQISGKNNVILRRGPPPWLRRRGSARRWC